jgi:Mce-associated membrane protein
MSQFWTVRVRRVSAILLAVLVVLALVVLVLELVLLRPRYRAALADQTARADVLRAAERFTAQVNDYDVASIDDYQATVGPLLSTKFRGEFENAMKDVVVSVKETQMASEGQVLTAAVAGVDRDSAQVLVVADADATTVYGPRQRHFRWQVSLVKVDGTWLVDDFEPVA